MKTEHAKLEKRKKREGRNEEKRLKEGEREAK